MSDQAQKLRKKVNQNKLSSVIDEIKNIHNIEEVYNNLVDNSKSAAEVLMFISAKGGAGKTYILSMFAHYISLSGKRTAIIDLNKYFHDTIHYFPAARQIKINKDTILSNSNFSDVDSNEGVKYIFTIENEVRGIEQNFLKIAIQQSKLSDFDCILIDTPVISPEFAAFIIPLANTVYLTTSCDYSSFYNTSQFISNLNLLNQKFNLNIIYNFSDGNCGKYDNFFNDILKNKENISIEQFHRINADRTLTKLNKSNYNISDIKKYALSAIEIKQILDKSGKSTKNESTAGEKKTSFFDKIFGSAKSK